MALKYSTDIRGFRLSLYESVNGIGTTPKLRFYTSSVPANPAAAATGTMLCEIVLPSNWLNDPSAGVVTKAGTWTGTAVATGTATYFRIYDNAGTTCHIQGTAGTSGDLVLDSASFTTGQTVTITTAQITGSNA